MNEEWRPIPWAPGYEVSEFGRIASWKPVRNNNPPPETRRMLKPAVDKDGYRRYTLRTPQGERLYVRACRVVAQVWYGDPSSGQIVRHLDGVNTNDHFSNLLWGTPAENSADAIKHGTVARGACVNTSRLSEAQVREVLTSNASHTALARAFGVTVGAIWHIRNKRSWKHVCA